MKTKTSFLILHDIRSAHNVGSLFRTADAAGVAKIFLTGYTPAPLDRFKRPNKEIAKTALGAEKSVPWQKSSWAECLDFLHAEGAFIVALEQDKRAVSYRNFKTTFPFALVLGNEVDGISSDVLNDCDAVVEIPMHGSKESLNVAVAGGIALFTLLER
jgi:tRNA G18 (ribose-2'-O)-methylase SpoU